jgi:hypothetical protein
MSCFALTQNSPPPRVVSLTLAGAEFLANSMTSNGEIENGIALMGILERRWILGSYGLRY